MSMTARRPPGIIELVRGGQIETIEKLIADKYYADGSKFDINERNYLGGCAVMMAAEYNGLEMLQVLVEKGKAELSVVDFLGRSPFSRARELGHDQVADWIKQKLAEKKNVASSSHEPKATKTIHSVNAHGVFSKPKEKDDCKDNQSTTPTNHRPL